MEKTHSFALVWAALGCSAVVVGCTAHDTTSSSTNTASGSAGSSVSNEEHDEDEVSEAGATGTQAAIAGASATDGSIVSGTSDSSTSFGTAGSSAGGNTGTSAAGGDAGRATDTGEGGSSMISGGANGATAGGDSGLVAGSAGTSSSPATPLNGYTLYADAYADRAALLDMNGNVVNTWNVGGIPVKMLPGGDVIGGNGLFPGDYDRVRLSQVSWTGEERWGFQDFASVGDGTFAARQHHDFEREGNPVGYYAPGQTFVDHGSTLVLAHSFRTVPEIREEPLDDDVIYELDGAGAFKGMVWQAADHIAELGFDDAALADIRTRNPGTTLEWLHGNSMSLVGPNHWFDEGHSEFAPNNIIYSSRNANIVLIIERETGKVVWRIGPDFAGRPEEKLGQFSGQHNPHLIPKGLPGAGNMLVFDNGWSSGYGGPNDTNRYSRGWSRALEFDPVTFDTVWQYGSESGSDNVYSTFLGNDQRLPNGNTVITLGALGRVIEVAPNKEIVWEYDYAPGGAAGLLYRTYRIPPEWLPAGVNAAQGNYPLWSDLFPTE